MDWKKKIEVLMSDFIRRYERESGTTMRWKTPLVGVANASAPELAALRELVHPEHAMPEDILPGALTVVSYFLPYPEEVAHSNRTHEHTEELSIRGTNAGASPVSGNPCSHFQDGGIQILDSCIHVPAASARWAEAYRETNLLFERLNEYMVRSLGELNHDRETAALPLSAASMDNAAITSRWSQRHVARIAGLGTFGLNNMLITKQGCCGRFSSFVTKLKLPLSAAPSEERCLFLRSGTCGLCVRRCPSGALTETGFDRTVCLEVCQANQALHDPGLTFGTDSEVCGKCLIDLPCTHKAP